MTNPTLEDLSTRVIIEEPAQVKLESGRKVNINRLKSRELFKLLRVITKGAGAGILDMRLDPNEAQSEFVMKLMGMILFSIPEAELEAIEFIFALVEPIGVLKGRKLTQAQKDRNLELWTELADELDNPSLDDLVTIIEAVVEREAPDLMRLGKRLKSMWDMAKKAGKVPNPPDPTSLTSLAQNTSEPLPTSVTSSAENMAGPMTTSSGSPSVVSVNLPRLSPEDVT